MSLYNTLLGKKLGGGGGGGGQGTIYLTQNNHTYDVRDYAEAVTQIPTANMVEVSVTNNTGFALNMVMCLDASGKSVSSSTTISNGRGRTVYYPVNKNAIMQVYNAPIICFTVNESAQGQVRLAVSSNKTDRVWLLQEEFEDNGSYYLKCAIIASVNSAGGTVLTLTASS